MKHVTFYEHFFKFILIFTYNTLKFNATKVKRTCISAS